MAPYFILFGVWVIGTIQFSLRADRIAYERILYVVAVAITALMVGLRYQVGADWVAYEAMYDDISMRSLNDGMTYSEPAYVLLNWISARVDGGIYLVNLGCAIVFMMGLSSLCRKQLKPWLAMTIAIPYLVIVVGMGYTRQAAAIGIICWAIATAEDDRIWKVVAKVAFATMFHKTAILFLPILLAPVVKRNWLAGIFGGILFVILGLLTLRNSSDQLITEYVTSNYQSSGAAIRIGLNVTAALLFFIFRKRFNISSYQRTIWTIVSFLSFICLIILYFASSSVGTDRIALFLLPLQIFVYSNIPFLIDTKRSETVFLIFSVISYAFAIEYVYFFHGSFSYAWLPYRTSLIVDN